MSVYDPFTTYDHTMSVEDVDALRNHLLAEGAAMLSLAVRVGRQAHETRWPDSAWPGGYQLVYVADDGEDVCPPCMNDASNHFHFAGPDDGWKITWAYIAEEREPEDGEEIRCAHCNRLIYPYPEET